MNYLPKDIVKALKYTVLLWFIGFVWGMVVFMTPSLNSFKPISGISKYPLITIPLVLVYIVILFVFSKNYLKDVKEKASEAIKFGVAIAVINFILDFIVYFVFFHSPDYFSYISIFVSYLLMLLIPWFVAKNE